MIRVRLCHAAYLAASVLWPSSSWAQDLSYPHLDVEVVIELQNDAAFKSDDPALELNDFFTKTEPAIALYLTENFSVQTGLVIEPLLDPGPADDRFFGDTESSRKR